MLKILRTLLLTAMLASCFTQLTAQTGFWSDAAKSDFQSKQNNPNRKIKPTEFRSFVIYVNELKSTLSRAPKEFTVEANSNPLVISLPLPNGMVGRFAVAYSPIMEPALEAQFPNIKTYSGKGIDDPTATLRMDWTDYGMHVQVLSSTNNSSFYIDPYLHGETTQYMSYYKKDLPNNRVYVEGQIEEQINNLNPLMARTTAGPNIGSQLRTYRLAIANTGEYAVAIGATTVSQVLSAVTTTINRVTGIYQTELAIKLVLIANETSLLNTDPGTDPFTGNDVATTLITESQNVITSTIGSANFDVGHTFSTGAGGLAGLGVVCNDANKARGVTGSPSPTGDAYDVDYVAHELGHQFGGNHTFNAATSNCGGGNRSSSSSVEPGSGITIMAYAGICGANNDLAAHSIPYFHAFSQNQIYTYATNTSAGMGGSCPVVTSTGNAIPVVNAGTDYTIPKSTPFALTGSATDVNNSEVLTYSWEEMDLGIVGNWNSGNKPFFRSFPPTLSKTRYFPQMSDIVNGTTTIGEYLPSTAQSLNFRLTARDNRPSGGGVASADMVLTVDGTNGPFTVTSQSSAITWTAGGSATVTWNVANTTASPFNTANVAILFSADGGYTYPYTLLASTPNNGSASVTVPSIKTGQGRVMVKAIGNVFFNINSANITISTTCNAEGAVISPSTSVTAQYASPSLNLSLAPQYSATFAPSGQIVTGDPITNLSLYDQSTLSCGGPYCNIYKYQTFQFVVSQTGSYTFQRSGPGSVFGIYTPSFNPSAMCSNLVTNNYNAGTVASINASLTAGTTYTLVIGVYTGSQSGSGGCADQAFNTGASNTLPFSYSFTITPPAGGAVYAGTGYYGNPGGGFNYTYVVVNNATNNIVSIGGTNLTNSSTYPVGQYTIYGLSYSNTISNLNSYVGGSLSNLITQIGNNPSTFCANLSKNNVTVNITGTFPVQLTALKARKQGETVSLDWSTLTEQNSDRFDVQRSANGTNFSTELGTVKAVGNSSTETKYNLVDVSPIKGWNYYRLKMVDKDGKYDYSNIAAVNFERGTGLMVIYPNPAKDKLNIEYTSERAGKLELQVVDSKGSVLISTRMAVSSGKNLESINVSSLSSGMYLLKYIDADGNMSFTKFVKQ